MNRITAIITLFNPAPNNINNVFALAEHCDRVIICDNSPVNHETMFENSRKIFYRTELQNLGLSAAFNRVLRDKAFAWENDEYVIFFDQDSVINNTDRGGGINSC